MTARYAPSNLGTGVYIIQNLVTRTVYVGQTTSTGHRWDRHFRELRDGTHHNHRMPADYERHGHYSFRMAMVTEVDTSTFDLEVIEGYVHRAVKKAGFRTYNLAPTVKPWCEVLPADVAHMRNLLK